VVGGFDRLSQSGGMGVDKPTCGQIGVRSLCGETGFTSPVLTRVFKGLSPNGRLHLG